MTLDESERFYNNLERKFFERVKMRNPYVTAWNKDNKFREYPESINKPVNEHAPNA